MSVQIERNNISIDSCELPLLEKIHVTIRLHILKQTHRIEFYYRLKIQVLMPIKIQDILEN